MERIPCLDRRLRARVLCRWRVNGARCAEATAEWIARGIALALLLTALPLLIAMWMAGRRWRPEVRVGKDGRTIRCAGMIRGTNSADGVAAHLPLLWNVVRGELAWAGPAPRGQHRLDLRREETRRIVSVRPGLVCRWRVQQQTSIAYGTQVQTDLEFVNNWSAKGNLGLIVRAALSALYGRSNDARAAVSEILGLPIDNLSLGEAVDRIATPSGESAARQVSFLNADCVNRAMRDRDYRRVLIGSDLRLGDGVGLRIGGRILRSEIRENVNGTDLFPRLCRRLETEQKSIYLLGGKPGIAAAVADWIRTHYPRLRVAGTRHGYFDRDAEPEIIEDINRSGASILLVAFGAPLQEKWISRNLQQLRVDAALGVGGLFDFYSGRIPRAPEWLRELGLEWTFRLYQEPGRMWRRYLVGNFVFLARVSAARVFGSYSRKLKTQTVNL